VSRLALDSSAIRFPCGTNQSLVRILGLGSGAGSHRESRHSLVWREVSSPMISSHLTSSFCTNLGFDQGAEGQNRVLESNLCAKCAIYNQRVTRANLFDTEEVVGSNPVVPYLSMVYGFRSHSISPKISPKATELPRPLNRKLRRASGSARPQVRRCRFACSSSE